MWKVSKWNKEGSIMQWSDQCVSTNDMLDCASLLKSSLYNVDTVAFVDCHVQQRDMVRFLRELPSTMVNGLVFKNVTFTLSGYGRRARRARKQVHRVETVLEALFRVLPRTVIKSLEISEMPVHCRVMTDLRTALDSSAFLRRLIMRNCGMNVEHMRRLAVGLYGESVSHGLVHVDFDRNELSQEALDYQRQFLELSQNN